MPSFSSSFASENSSAGVVEDTAIRQCRSCRMFWTPFGNSLLRT